MILRARLWALSALRGSGFQDVERHGTLTLRTPECRNVDVTRSRATCPLDGRLISFLACNIDATHRANPGAIPLTAISRRPSICSYGWIWAIDNIISLARLIFSLKWGFTCYAWEFFVQPATLDALGPETRIVANIRLHGGYIRLYNALRTHSAVSVPCCWAMESGSKHPAAENTGQKIKAKKNKDTCSKDLIYIQS